MLAGPDESGRIMYHALKGHFEIIKVILEEPPPKSRMLARRAKKLGWLTVFGQMLFALYAKLMSRFAHKRIKEIKQAYAMNDRPYDVGCVVHVASINDEAVIGLLQRLAPQAAVVNGTRIIAPKILNAIKVPFVNTHMGITPAYRGVHGGYWALAREDAAHCGVTIHLVDPGIDTGGILYQKQIEISKRDTFCSYPYLQLAWAIPLMKRALEDVQDGRLRTVSVDLPSRLWYHPTLWTYFVNYVVRGVR
jgi:methionyl-tRNA formyltransferase